MKKKFRADAKDVVRKALIDSARGKKDFRVWSIHESCAGGIKNCAGQCDCGSNGENCRIGGSHEEKRKGTAWLY